MFIVQILSMIIMTNVLAGNADYFSPQSKKEFLLQFKNRLYAGCSDLKAPQLPVSNKDMGLITQKTKIIVLNAFKKSFQENPELRKGYIRELDELAKDLSCQRVANDCRSRLLGLSIFYFHQLRPDIPRCENYISQAESSDTYNNNCESELKYRKRSFEGIHGNQYGNLGPGNYKNQLMALKNQITKEIFDIAIREDNNQLHICNPVREGGLDYRYNLETEGPGEFVENLDPVYDPRKALSNVCKEDSKNLLEEMVLAHFDESRNTLGRDQFDGIKKTILTFLGDNPQFIVTEVSLVSLSSRTPYYTEVAGKKVIDPDSDGKNLKVVQERGIFGQKMLEEIRESSTLYKTIKFESKGQLAGPVFSPLDLNERFVTKMSPGYHERIEALYKKHEDLFKNEAKVSTYGDLLNEDQFSNIYQAKFKPFHGIKIIIRGLEKNNQKCADNIGTKTNFPSSKQ